MFTSYIIEGDNLILNEQQYYEFEPNRKDAVKVWTLHNYDKASVTEDLLNLLISDYEEVDTEVTEKGLSKIISFFCYADHTEFTITCSDLSLSNRSFNEQELNKIVLNLYQRCDNDYRQIVEQRRVIDGIKSFIAKEMDRKEKINNSQDDENSKPSVKSRAQLDLLNQLNNILQTLEDNV